MSFANYKEIFKSDDYSIKIYNLTCKFDCGNLYYLEAPNGIGKSTLLSSSSVLVFLSIYLIHGKYANEIYNNISSLIKNNNSN